MRHFPTALPALLLLSSALGCGTPAGHGVHADFAVLPQTGPAPLHVKLADHSQGAIDSWKWDFESDGKIDSTEQNPDHVYGSPGHYRVTLTVSGPDGTDRSTHEVMATDAPAPDLSWQPQPFQYVVGDSVRYIDFASGSDDNPGTRAQPFKHHPWDPAATGNAAAATGVDTWVFKRGVVYRGALVADESGNPGHPIRLTADPDWGQGQAVLEAAVVLPATWQVCTAAACPDVPAKVRGSVWFSDPGLDSAPRELWLHEGGQVTRLNSARWPDWTVTNPDDPRSGWYEATDVVTEDDVVVDNAAGFKAGDTLVAAHGYRVLGVNGNKLHIESDAWNSCDIVVGHTVTNGTATATVASVGNWVTAQWRIADTVHLTNPDPAFYRGATLWIEGAVITGGNPNKVLDFDPSERSLRIGYYAGPGQANAAKAFDRYYLSGLPQYLDVPGEWARQSTGSLAGRIYLRLPGDESPNAAVVVAAHHQVALTLEDVHDIEVSNLTLRHINPPPLDQDRDATWRMGLVQLKGSSQRISLHHLRLEHAQQGVAAIPERAGDRLDDISITDSDFDDIGSEAIVLSNGSTTWESRSFGARLVHVKILRNRLRHIGYRDLTAISLGAAGNAIETVGGELLEIAHNDIDDVSGAGIRVYAGAIYDNGHVAHPLLRTLIHHNRVTNSLRGLEDFGGISAWMGGPTYVYDNISGNAVGYMHQKYRTNTKTNFYRASSFAPGIYLDGQYKGYVFNNIVWGNNNDVNTEVYNAAGINEAMGFLNSVFNNTLYRVGVGLAKGMNQHNRCLYAGNLMLDIGDKYIRHATPDAYIERNTLAYANNVFEEGALDFGQLGQNLPEVAATPQEFNTLLGEALRADVGIMVPAGQTRDPAAHDFRLVPGSAAIDEAPRVFVPWGLYGVVGEWGFYQHPAHPTRVLGENINMDHEWVRREMFQDIPRNDLACPNAQAADYHYGLLEDWVKGALAFNGKNLRCVLSDVELRRDVPWHDFRTGASGVSLGKDRQTVDMGTNNLLIEVVVRVDPGSGAGGIVSKLDGAGYELAVTKNGTLSFRMSDGVTTASRASALAIDDGQWHHVVVDVTRSEADGIHLYVDGRAADGPIQGAVDGVGSLANHGDFVVGESESGAFLSGTLDFLRVSRGNLADAQTTIAQLRAWEFDGPFLRDLRGYDANGRRDAGALEWYK